MARIAAILACIAALAAPQTAFAILITVNTTSDVSAPGPPCSLREAVFAALSSSNPMNGCPAGTAGLDTIVLPPGNYQVLGMIPLGSNLILSGAGPSATTVTRTGVTPSRLFWVPNPITVEIVGMKLTGGQGADGPAAGGLGAAGASGDDGGAILNGGTLTLTNTFITGNRAGNGGLGGIGGIVLGGPGGNGGGGGAIYSTGSLTVVDSTISGNQAGNGGTGGNGAGFTSGPGGVGGSGGGIYSAGSLTVTNSSIANNSAGSGGSGGGGPSPGAAGGGGGGGGIYTSSTANITGTTISGNTAGAAAAGLGSAAAGAAGDGGGLLNNVGTLTVSNSELSENRTAAGGNSPSGVAQAGGDGGGLANTGGNVAISNTTINGNTAGNGGNGVLSGSGGLGGGLATFLGRMTLTNATVAGNAAGDGGFSLVQGAAGSGGGIAFVDGDLILVHATIAGNRTGSGASQLGGGIYSSGIGDPAASLTNSIVSSNSPQNCSLAGYGTLTGGAYSITFPDSTCPGVHADPKLGPLQDNGGPTPTMALLAGSAAIDRVPGVGADCLATDQRGVPRPNGSGCDSGAFEFVPPPLVLDATAPVATLVVKKQLLGAAFRKGYLARFTTNEPGKAVLELFTNVRKRPLAKIVRMRVAFGSRTVAAPGRYKIVAKFTRKAKKRFAKANRLVVSVRLTVSDAAGNKTVKTKRVVLKRR